MDVRKERPHMVKELGADETFLPGTNAIVQVIETAGKGVDEIIDFVGSENTRVCYEHLASPKAVLYWLTWKWEPFTLGGVRLQHVPWKDLDEVY